MAWRHRLAVSCLVVGGCTPPTWFQRSFYAGPTRIATASDDVYSLEEEFGNSHFGLATQQFIQSMKAVVTFADGKMVSASDDQDKLSRYLLDGQNLSRTFCNEYLESLGDRNARLEYVRKWVVLGGGVSEAIIGVVGADATVAVLTALGFTNVLTALDDYQEFAYLAQDQQALCQLVHSAQDSVAKSYQKQPPSTFSDTLVALQTFEMQCSRNGIRNLVLQAVKAGDAEFDRTTRRVSVTSFLQHRQQAAELLVNLRAEKRVQITKDLEDAIGKHAGEAGLKKELKDLKDDVKKSFNQEDDARSQLEKAIADSDSLAAQATALIEALPDKK